MSEEVQETVSTVVPEVDDESLSDDLSIEDYKQIVSKLRKEAGARRIRGKDADAQLKEYEDWKQSQLSEVERVKADKAKVEEELTKYRKRDWREDAAREAKLDPEYADLIVGESEADMVKHAKALKAKLDSNSTTRSVLNPGGRGTPVVGSASNANEWFRSMFD